MSTDARARVLIGAIGLAGHALPAIALGRELRARGHAVRFCTVERWRELVEGLGIEFAGGPESIAATSSGFPGSPDASVAEVVRALLPSLDEFRPDVVVSDALTLTPALAAEVRRVPSALLFPEVYPFGAAGHPFFSLGLFPPRTRLGAAGWRVAAPLLATRLPTTRWLRWSQRALNQERAELGLPPVASGNRPAPEQLTLVATLPQLEYPRRWPAGVHVTGPMSLHPPHPEVALPAGDAPLVLIAPSTVKDPDGRLVRVALEALASEPVRLVVTTGGADRRIAVSPPANAVVSDWVDYSQVMPEASLVVCHGNHGTVTAALAEGVPLVVSPAMPDDAEHGARVAWADAGLMVPRPLLRPRSLRAAVRRVLARPGFTATAQAIRSWCLSHNGAARGAELVERFANDAPPATRGLPAEDLRR
jgi:UDP:flavonoid glycosyltransferase YjiC (YdhE family)